VASRKVGPRQINEGEMGDDDLQKDDKHCSSATVSMSYLTRLCCIYVSFIFFFISSCQLYEFERDRRI
jgi:hypothetical protein